MYTHSTVDCGYLLPSHLLKTRVFYNTLKGPTTNKKPFPKSYPLYQLAFGSLCATQPCLCVALQKVQSIAEIILFTIHLYCRKYLSGHLVYSGKDLGMP